MSQQVSARNIGLFAIGAILVLTAGLLVFGSGDWFQPEQKVEMAFEGNVKGLAIGSYITFRGVRIGEVRTMNLELDESETRIVVRVTGIIVPQGDDPDPITQGEHLALIQNLVAQGVAAQLVAENMVTGRLQVQLEFFEDLEKFSLPSKYNYPVIPTVPSDYEIVADVVQDLVDDFKAIAQGLNNILGSEESQATAQQLRAAITHLNSILSVLDNDKETLSTELMAATQSVRQMADSINEAAVTARPALKSASASLALLDTTLQGAMSTLKTYQQAIQPGSELSVALIQTLGAFERSADQVRQLAETLQRNPESLLMGKQP
ncbi:MCE family protein [Exilibacterium tricleocarpae]|uniref:MCE family protein n=1 Tax=Exilibacterium tricleocarpae TaxID=2591008 RepID=A0A545U9N7_9GAMM|nr:MlaD family protein [Exilibacterium tricleocarpae]TQV86149.1 MCE family protein [Exilibacterium tricleocarpae]